MPALDFTTDAATAADTTHTAIETADFPTGGDDLTIAGGVTVIVTSGNLTLIAGDDVILQSGSRAIASGSVLVAIGGRSGDLDSLGGIQSHGLVQGTNVTFVGF
ncbi:MAG TPA: hypothetical protein VHN20_13790, partial [Beijerinckiaceae bacterium]|nr:hypothetical protein [Beijerinckiaceae bacterium]